MTEDWKAKATEAFIWAKEHPGFTVPLFTFFAGVIVGAVVF